MLAAYLGHTEDRLRVVCDMLDIYDVPMPIDAQVAADTGRAGYA
jgi:hypothetical protein